MTNAPSYIYFVQAASGPIKVGFSHRPYARFGALRAGNAERLTMLGCMPGTLRDEAELHDRFAASRVNGEWFRPDDALVKFIADNASHLGAQPPAHRPDAHVTREQYIEIMADALRRGYGEGPAAVRAISEDARATQRAVRCWLAKTAAMQGHCLLNLMRRSPEVLWAVLRACGMDEQMKPLVMLPRERRALVIAGMLSRVAQSMTGVAAVEKEAQAALLAAYEAGS
ncbi:MAG: GIY-YIG nuclease family protein [Alphaproteobacteria bacterium]